MTSCGNGFQPWFGQLAAAMVLIVVGAGCRHDEPIVTHRVPKSRSGLESLQTRVDGTPAIATDRMVVAIYQLDDATWFFKLNGTRDRKSVV